MRAFRIAFFGEAERGKFAYPYLCTQLPQLFHTLGNPPQEAKGLHLAIRAILRGGEVYYFRVDNEGFSEKHYRNGFRYLQKQDLNIDALFLPGVSHASLVQSASELCQMQGWLFLLEESDLFDYFTA